MRKRLTAWLLALVMALTLVGCGDDFAVITGTTGGDQEPQQQQQDMLPDGNDDETPDAPDDGADVAIDEDGSYTSKEDVALYIHTYGHLPGNFITKKEAQALGWSGGSLESYAPGKCIGGSHFGNYEGLLPEAEGRSYTECDIDTLGAGSRGTKRIVFSNDGLIYYTGDHYESFELLYSQTPVLSHQNCCRLPEIIRKRCNCCRFVGPFHGTSFRFIAAIKANKKPPRHAKAYPDKNR